MSEQTAAIILLVGQKGAGKTTIGARLAQEPGIEFLRVEPIYLAAMRNHPELSSSELEPVGFGAIVDAVEEQVRRAPVLCLESTGTAGYFPEFLGRLRSLGRVYLVHVLASEEECLARVRGRDQSQHIPVSDERVREINRIAMKVTLPWDLEIDNAEGTDVESVVETILDLLKPAGPTQARGTPPIRDEGSTTARIN